MCGYDASVPNRRNGSGRVLSDKLGGQSAQQYLLRKRGRSTLAAAVAACPAGVRNCRKRPSVSLQENRRRLSVGSSIANPAGNPGRRRHCDRAGWGVSELCLGPWYPRTARTISAKTASSSHSSCACLNGHRRLSLSNRSDSFGRTQGIGCFQ